MTKQYYDRLAFIEAAQADGSGEFLFVEERGGLFYDVHTDRAYTGATLQALHDARQDLVVLCVAGDTSDVPPHPASNPGGWTENDRRLYNELVMRKSDPLTPPLTPAEQAVLDDRDAAQKGYTDAYEAWEAATQPAFDEAVRRVERLNARARSKRR